MINLIAGSKIFMFFSGWPFWICAIVMMLVVLIYILMGGFKAVVKTDILQYVAMLFIMVLLFIILFKGSIIPPSDWNIFTISLPNLIGFFIAGILFPFAMPDMWQRVYSSKNKQTLKRGIISSAIIYFVFAFLLILIALTVKSQFPGADPDLALLHGFGSLLPTGLLGLSVVLLFAAIMSTIDTSIFTSSSAIIQDYFNWNKKKTIKNIRRVIFIVSVLGALAAIAVQNLVIGAYIFIAALVVLAMIVIITWMKIRVRSLTLLSGFVLGLVVFFIALIVGMTTGSLQPTIVLYSLVATLIGLLAGSIVSYFKYRKFR